MLTAFSHRWMPECSCLVLLAACGSPDRTLALQGAWASRAETDYSYPAASCQRIPRRYGPTSVVGKSRLVITPDSFIHYDARGPFLRRITAPSYQHRGAVIHVPESGQQFVLKLLTADTLKLVYAHPTPTGTPFDYGHVDTGFTFTRLHPTDEAGAAVRQFYSFLKRLFPAR